MKVRYFVQMPSFYFHLQVENWELFEKIMDYIFQKNFRTDPEYHPVLFSEPPVSGSMVLGKLVGLCRGGAG